MSEVKQVFSGDKSNLENAYRDLAKEVVRLESQVQRMSASSVRAALNQNTALRGVGREVVSLGAQYVTLQGIIQGFGKTFTEFGERGRESLNFQKSLAGAQAQFIQNYAGDAGNVKINLDFAQQVVREGFPDLALAQAAITNAVSAASGNDELARAAVREAAKYTQHTPQYLDTFSGAAVDIAQAGGVTPEEALALVFSSQSLGRINDPGLNSRNLAQAIGRSVASQRGDKKAATEAAAEMFSWLSTEANDQRGDTSATAMANLSAHLDEFFTKGVEQDFGGFKYRIKPQIPDPGNARDRMRALMNSPRDARAFAEHYKAEAGYDQIIDRALLDPNSDQRKGFEAMVGGVGYDLEGLRRRKAQLDSLTPQLRIDKAEATSKGLAQIDQLKAERESQAASAYDAVRNIYRDTREHSRLAWPIAPMLEETALKTQSWTAWLFGGDPNKIAAETLEKRRDELLTRDRTLLGGRAWFDNPRTYAELNEREKSQYDRITGEIGVRRGLIEEAKRGRDPGAAADAKALLEEQRKQTRLLEEQNKLLRENHPVSQPGAGPAMNAQRGIQSER